MHLPNSEGAWLLLLIYGVLYGAGPKTSTSDVKAKLRE